MASSVACAFPREILNLFTPMQLLTFSELSVLGWDLYDILRPADQEPTILVQGPLTRKVVVLQQDGMLDYSPNYLPPRQRAAGVLSERLSA